MLFIEKSPKKYEKILEKIALLILKLNPNGTFGSKTFNISKIRI